MRKWVVLYTAVVMLITSSQTTAAAQGGTGGPTLKTEARTALQQQVQIWQQSLSKQPLFESWQDANPNIVPIGPGLHGWLVTLRLDNKPVGYMIIHATQDGGFALGEYGVGDRPAFDPNTLYESLVRQGFYETYADAASRKLKLERNYIHPLQAVWKWTAPEGDIYYLDAWTAEMLPIDEQQWQQQTSKLNKPLIQDNASLIKQLSAARTNRAFDPYERMPWLTKSPLTADQMKQLPLLLDRKTEIRFTAELYDESVLFVWPAVGYHQWDHNNLFVAFDQLGTRYVPLDTLSSDGRFYR
ncbi:hypothetical protein PAECIP111893_02596 [Paenibacillus plantiphilus]|uniref:Uncharacterized protein n=1 Tax=Paenibacillus plantiphilus TaxID=2905650 RepID=A0ABN8GE93_9BACL|nr:hypothetical protein [Paenibacillus plantiphilus]CAH1206730.1 hypothetical protein PAECIP111893_02596 [Paenibacillus plantiphilus]